MFIELIEHILVNLNTVKQVSPHGKRTALFLEHGTIITDEPYSELSKRIMTIMKMTVKEYKGYGIDFNVYGMKEYTVQYCGDDLMFKTLEEAEQFINEIEQ